MQSNSKSGQAVVVAQGTSVEMISGRKMKMISIESIDCAIEVTYHFGLFALKYE